MYTGSDSTDAQNYTQWPLNSSFPKMSNEHVDWAALAQQWIIMKEAGPPVPEQVTNPPPATAKLKKDPPNEGGEAPMEVENDCEESSAQWNEGTGSGDSWHWNQQQWNWNNSWSAPPGVPPPTTTKQPLLPTPPAYNQYPNPDNCNDNGNYGEYSGNYWSSTGSSKVIKPHNKRYSKVNVPTTVSTSKPINLDAAKRKQLPAWIREGLEKMERDKLKQLDKARENQEKAEYQAKLKLNEKNAMEILKDTVKEQQQKSKFESEAEESEDDNNGRPLTPEDPPLTQEDLMLKVRKTMTEILLKVTNREIYTICKEELQRHLKKMKASDQRVSAPSGANLSAKLGLGVYDASGSSSDSSDESSRDQHSSDTELRDTIKRRKMEFIKTEREIEDKLAEAEKHDGGESKPTSPNQSDIDSQVDAKVIDSKKNSRERTPPMKNNSRRKSRKSVSSTSSSSDSDHSDNRVKGSRGRRHSSTSVSSDSDDKYKRNSGSRTPEYRRIKQNRAKVDDLDQGLRVDGDDPDLLLIREMTDLHRETDIGGLEVDLGLSLTTGNHHTTDHADPRREVEDPHPILEEDADLTLGGPDHPVPELEDSEDQGRIVAGGVRGHTDIEISPPPFWIIQDYLLKIRRPYSSTMGFSNIILFKINLFQFV
ncbi:Arginine/serine-rich protein PNISR [Popillia japonica]|uniref:Arginine/serine-rich protein PNISR n=1 Tax=Popillia japonica TaxID=7064 RepID=A0AAW1LBI4_POPJA